MTDPTDIDDDAPDSEPELEASEPQEETPPMNAAKKIAPAKPVSVYKLFKTDDKALHFHLTVDPEDDEPTSLTVHDTDTGDEIELAIDKNGIGEVIQLLTAAAAVLARIERGEAVKSDEHEEYGEPGDEDDDDDEEDE